MSDDIFDRYSRDVKPKASSVPATDDDVFSRYERKADAAPVEKAKVKAAERPRPRGDVADMSGFNNRMVSSIPIVGPLFDKATAAAGAAIQPLFVKPKTISDLVTGEKRPGSEPNFADRYQANLAKQDEANHQYAEQHPVASTAADVAGAMMLLGPASQTGIGARMMGLKGNSLGARVYQGAGGMGVLETANQLLKGNNPLDQGFLGPVPLAMVGGAIGPMAGEAISSGANKLMQWLPRRTGELAGVNSVGRNMLVNALEGETPASIAEAQRKFGPAGMLADVNQATTDLAGGLADIPGPHKQVVRDAYRQRAAGQAQRIEQSLDQNTVPYVPIADMTRAIEKARSSGTDALYNQFRTMAVQPTEEIKALIPRLEKAGAFDLAEELSGISGRPINRKFFTGGPQKEFPTAETWDYVKRGLDRRVTQALDRTKPDKELARELLNLKGELLSEIDKTPAGKIWQKAREKFAEQSELLHQIEEGQKTFARNTRYDELAHELINLSTPERAARLQGARDAIQQVIDNSVRGDTTARNMLLSKSGRQKLELLFGQKRADKLVGDLEAEVLGKGKVENVIGGSQTTPKRERVGAMLPTPSEMGYVSNLDITRPASFIPEWMKPQTILEGARAQRYSDAYSQIAPLLTRKIGDHNFNALTGELLSDRLRLSGLQKRLDQVGQAASLATAVSGPALRNRLLDDADTPRSRSQSRR
ncbi:hypothetical protein QA649_08955 [Bradyrhizobium sp. CB1717]|uniref:hypothetical protein n=1 Tax=Bradyrhizobium sp. CB1717 TaxID=3039154 RepID=UPI0024B10C90|nr:hypothetical protein [Bradyrhizobium sp. CB1717]WFU26319.1 hypothetical protein QA649_08955 [Bradyrhizobium sp. CB1717]